MEGLPPSLLALSTYLLSRTGKAARGRMAAGLAARGSRMPHMAVLAALADFGPDSQRGLSARLGIDPSDLVKVLDELAAPGYVQRARDPSDRRRTSVELTDAGRTELDHQLSEATAVQDELLAPLAPQEREQLHALLQRVHEGLQ
ncbi:MarR family winged helix-turn-helix transcriptional regulator [Nonomuraea sp. NPDC000554]|uniref:MarR family winged helix-turn-helix transcriptional regulator n=1 Tax=Nonomuraea sp. NPDC000554 TaxID=3154259 RepID=UPI003319B9FB